VVCGLWGVWVVGVVGVWVCGCVCVCGWVIGCGLGWVWEGGGLIFVYFSLFSFLCDWWEANSSETTNIAKPFLHLLS